jgi:hypothetical protein
MKTVKLHIGKCKTNVFYVYDSLGLTFHFFSKYSQAEKYYEKLKVFFNIKNNTYPARRIHEIKTDWEFGNNTRTVHTFLEPKTEKERKE